MASMSNHRRGFLAGAAATFLQGQTRDHVRLGIIGLGGRGKALLREAAHVKGARITHLCEIDQSRLEQAQQLAQKEGAGATKGTADMRRVFDDREIDAVLIATPDHWHAPAAILACQAGKDVYVEKPVSHNLREGRLLVEAARKYKRIVQAGMQSRSRPNTMRAIDVVKSGRLGRVLMAKAWNVQRRKNVGHGADAPPPAGVDYDTWVGPAEMLPYRANRFHYDWHWHWNFGTGDMGNDGAHQLDIARWVLGATAPRRVTGGAGKYYFDDDQQTPDSMNMTFEFGAQAIIWEMRIWTPYALEGTENGVGVYGTDAMMHIGRWGRGWEYRVYDDKGKLAESNAEGGPEAHVQNFVDCVLSRQKPNGEIEEGHLSNSLCHLGNICARTGRNLAFDARSESIPGDAEAQALTRRKYRAHWGAPKG